MPPPVPAEEVVAALEATNQSATTAQPTPVVGTWEQVQPAWNEQTGDRGLLTATTCTEEWMCLASGDSMDILNMQVHGQLTQDVSCWEACCLCGQNINTRSLEYMRPDIPTLLLEHKCPEKLRGILFEGGKSTQKCLGR